MADDPILSAIESVRADVRDLKSDVSGRLAETITRKEHEAEVRRIDAEHRMLGESLAQHITEAERDSRELQHLREEVKAQATATVAAAAAVKQARADEREVDERRWTPRARLWTAVSTIAAVVLAVFTILAYTHH